MARSAPLIRDLRRVERWRGASAVYTRLSGYLYLRGADQTSKKEEEREDGMRWDGYASLKGKLSERALVRKAKCVQYGQGEAEASDRWSKWSDPTVVPLSRPVATHCRERRPTVANVVPLSSRWRQTASHCRKLSGSRPSQSTEPWPADEMGRG